MVQKAHCPRLAQPSHRNQRFLGDDLVRPGNTKRWCVALPRKLMKRTLNITLTTSYVQKKDMFGWADFVVKAAMLPNPHWLPVHEFEQHMKNTKTKSIRLAPQNNPNSPREPPQDDITIEKFNSIQVSVLN